MHRLSIEDLTGLNPKELNFVIEYCRDKSPRRAAEAAGYSADYGNTLREMDHISAAIDKVLQNRLETAQVDAEWLLGEAVEVHNIALHRGKLNSSLQALNLIAKHTMVDAIASDKLNLNVHADKDVVDRLTRGRARVRERGEKSDPPSFF